MLKHLRIRNLALIESADIDFDPGFCAITGETGAGKSVLLSSLKICSGGKTSPQMVRHGEEKATVEAYFEIDDPEIVALLNSWEIDCPDGEIVIQREILSNGKSRSRINGTLVKVSNLALLGDQLLQLHGQSEQVMLRDTRTHLQLIDDFGDFKDLKKQYHQLWQQWQQSVKAVGELRDKAQALAAQKEFLSFQFKELDKAELVAGEEENLEAELRSTESETQKIEAVSGCLNILEKDHGLLDQLHAFQKNLENVVEFSPLMAELSQKVAEFTIAVEDANHDLNKLNQGSSLSEYEIEKINSRLAQLQRLRRKYHLTIAELISLRDQRAAELDSLQNFDADLEHLQHQEVQIKAQLMQVGTALRQQRQSAAQDFERQVVEILQTLGMPKVLFNADFEALAEPTAQGLDKMEFKIAPNMGEGLKSLQQAVSGGELSRVLLAFKTVMAHRDAIPLLIFDEVDAGISGEIAHHIGNCLQELGKFHQVMTITHLHQVASKAAWQIFVYKQEDEGRTYTQIKPLDQAQRIRELARMLGDTESAAVLQHAQELYKENHG